MLCLGNIRKLLKSNKTATVLTISESQAFSTNMSAASQSSNANKAVLIFLHGLGDQGSSWHLQLSTMIPSYIKCLCPTAPVQSVTLNMGMQMNSWFDLRSLNPLDPEDEEGINAACKRIHDLIDEQEKLGIPHNRIMLGGFSQGGALSLYSALRYPKKLAGVVALSCWLPLHRNFPAAATEANKQIPVIQCHGNQDVVVPLNWGRATEVVLSTFLDKTNYQFKVYNGLGHSSSTAELADALDFIRKHLPKL